MNKDIENRLKEYGEFEKNIDNIVVSSFDYSSAYLNDILDFFHINIAMKYSGERFDTDKYNIEPPTSFSSIFSYLLPFLNSCKKDFNNEYFENIFISQMMNIRDTLIKYGLFSEVAPFVWRKVYIPDITCKNLRMHYNTNYYEYEVKDAILTEIATGFSASNDLKNANLYDMYINLLINLNLDLTENLQIQETENSKEWYKKYRFDDLTISEELYNNLDILKNEYIEFQSFWLGITTYYIKMYEALVRYKRNTGNLNGNLLEKLLIHFASPNLRKKSFYAKFKKLIGIEEYKFLRLMNIFSLDVNCTYKLQDGHYPVFFEYKDLYLFSPFNVRVQLSPRNLLYLLNKNETANFNNISKYLEPQLIKYCINLLNKIPNLQIESNKNWGTRGEFDIIAYDNSNNNILHFQAKASIPVEGARMTQNLESRIKEGICQIERFNQQDSTTKDCIVSKIFNKQIINPQYIDIIVGWGGFGTYNIWESFNDKKITALNIAVLNQYIIKYNNAYNISNFYNDINNLINEIVDSSSPKKIINKLKIGRYKIYYDSFDYQKAKLLKYRYIPS